MLIGPTFTLSEFEEKLEDRLLQNRKRDEDLMKEFKSLQQKIAVLPRLVEDEITGEMIANKEYLEVYERSQKLQEEINDLVEQNDFLKIKLEELETIEERSRGAISKDKTKVTVTLKDCVDLGIEISEEE